VVADDSLRHLASAPFVIRLGTPRYGGQATRVRNAWTWHDHEVARPPRNLRRTVGDDFVAVHLDKILAVERKSIVWPDRLGCGRAVSCACDLEWPSR
jgi:hypothetical protein